MCSLWHGVFLGMVCSLGYGVFIMAWCILRYGVFIRVWWHIPSEHVMNCFYVS